MGRSASHIATVDPIRTFKVRRGLITCHVKNRDYYYGVVYKYLTKEKKKEVKNKNKKAIFLLNTEVEDMCLRKSQMNGP